MSLSMTFTLHGGREDIVAAEPGGTLMRAARDADVEGIVAECGGACSCATCHVIVAADWFAATGPIGEDEEAMLEMATGRQPTSRLSCQVTLTNMMDGLRISVPQSQY